MKKCIKPLTLYQLGRAPSEGILWDQSSGGRGSRKLFGFVWVLEYLTAIFRNYRLYFLSDSLKAA